MKKTLIAATCAATLGSAALAGGIDTYVAPEVVVVETETASSSSGATLVLLAALVVFAAAASH